MAELPVFGDWMPLLTEHAALLAQAAKGGGAPAGNGGLFEGLFGSMMLPLVATMALMYFLLMRPEQRKRKEMEKQLSTLKKNDHVVTIGGIYGTVIAASDPKFVTIRIDDSTGTKIRVLRSAISQVGAAEDLDSDNKGKPGE